VSDDKPGGGRDLAARLAAQAASLPQPEPPASPSGPRARRKRSGAPTAAGETHPAPMPREQSRPSSFYGERLSITTTEDQIRALRAARLADGIQATARIRAMIAIWQEDPRIRERIDRVARNWR
jgi:hypothetical protein